MSTVSGVSPNDATLTNWQEMAQQFKTNFSNLAQAIQSGDLSSAQKAFAALTQNTPSNANSQSTIQSDYDALSKALQSGDMNAAKTAFAKLQQDMQNLRKTHHHHKHTEQSNTNTDNTNTNADNTDNNAAASGDVNTLA